MGIAQLSAKRGVNVVVRADWQDCARTEYVESAIARTLTGDIYRADDRAMNSLNREIFAQQTQLAERIRSIRPKMLFDPTQIDRPQIDRPQIDRPQIDRPQIDRPQRSGTPDHAADAVAVE